MKIIGKATVDKLPEDCYNCKFSIMGEDRR